MVTSGSYSKLCWLVGAILWIGLVEDITFQTPQLHAEEPKSDFFDVWFLSHPKPIINNRWKLLEDVGQAHLNPEEKGWWNAPSVLPTPNTGFSEILKQMTPAPANFQSPSSSSSLNFSQNPVRWQQRYENRLDIGKLQARYELPDSTDWRNPQFGRDWYAEERLQVPLPISLASANSIFVYGHFGGRGDAVNNKQTNLSGKTGIGMRWNQSLLGDFQVKTGTVVSYSDVYQPRSFSERSQFALELLTIVPVPLLGKLELEYTGSAVPAVVPTDREEIRQEVRVAVPFGMDNELYVGARYRWEDVPIPTPWVDRTQLFFGLKFRH